MREAIYTATFKGFKLVWKVQFLGEVRYTKIGHLPAFVEFKNDLYMAVAKKNFLGKVLSPFYYTGQ